jgi:hypothetical protein
MSKPCWVAAVDDCGACGHSSGPQVSDAMVAQPMFHYSPVPAAYLQYMHQAPWNRPHGSPVHPSPQVIPISSQAMSTSFLCISMSDFGLCVHPTRSSGPSHLHSLHAAGVLNPTHGNPCTHSLQVMHGTYSIQVFSARRPPPFPRLSADTDTTLVFMQSPNSASLLLF